jgi:VanZ family protein
MISSKWIRGGCLAVAFFMAVLLFPGADKASQIPLLPYVPDKVLHFCYYGVMAVLLAHGLGRRWWWIPLGLVPLIGILDEWHQFYVPGRDASAYDWMADVLGTGVGMYGYGYALAWLQGKGRS